MSSTMSNYITYLVLTLGLLALGAHAQPPAGINPDDTEAIIDAYLADAAEHHMDDGEVDLMLEEIFRQDREHGGEGPMMNQAGETATQSPGHPSITAKKVREDRAHLPQWGEVHRSQPPRYGFHPPSRINKQPKDVNKTEDQVYQDNSTDLLRLEGGTNEDDTAYAISKSGKKYVIHSEGSSIANLIIPRGGAGGPVQRRGSNTHNNKIASSSKVPVSGGDTICDADTPEEEEVLVDDEEIHFREEHYQELRHTRGKQH